MRWDRQNLFVIYSGDFVIAGFVIAVFIFHISYRNSAGLSYVFLYNGVFVLAGFVLAGFVLAGFHCMLFICRGVRIEKKLFSWS